MKTTITFQDLNDARPELSQVTITVGSRSAHIFQFGREVTSIPVFRGESLADVVLQVQRKAFFMRWSRMSPVSFRTGK